jgi:hypothetical protein
MLSIYVANKAEDRHIEHASCPIEFGRDPAGEVARCVVQDPYIGRRQFRVEELQGWRVRPEDLNRKSPVRLADGTSGTLGAGRHRLRSCRSRRES